MSGYSLRPPAPNPAIEVALRHADPHLLVVDKPAGLTMHPGPEHGRDTLLNGLVARWPELLALGEPRGWGLVQRLDRETSGLVVVARTAGARDRLVEAFAARTVEKCYRALTRGAPREPAGTIEAPVDGKDAATRWEVVDRVGAGRWVVAMLSLRPLTGRKHQLRLHLASLGCPVLGDKRHGPATIPIAQQLGLRRLALHAEALAFAHPVTAEALSFEWPLPPELEVIWERARVAAST